MYGKLQRVQFYMNAVSVKSILHLSLRKLTKFFAIIVFTSVILCPSYNIHLIWKNFNAILPISTMTLIIQRRNTPSFDQQKSK